MTTFAIVNGDYREQPPANSSQVAARLLSDAATTAGVPLEVAGNDELRVSAVTLASPSLASGILNGNEATKSLPGEIFDVSMKPCRVDLSHDASLLGVRGQGRSRVTALESARSIVADQYTKCWEVV